MNEAPGSNFLLKKRGFSSAHFQQDFGVLVRSLLIISLFYFSLFAFFFTCYWSSFTFFGR